MFRRWFKISAGAAIGVTTITTLFYFLVIQYGFVIIDNTGDIICEGSYKNPCISEFTVRNPTKYNIDIYSKDNVKLEFIPEVIDYALFVKDSRCSATGSCRCELKDKTLIGYKSWRCIDFTNKTKPRADTSYVYRFASYSSTDFRLVGFKNPEESIKWIFGANSSELDPWWYNATGGATPTTGNVSVIYMELGSQVNITANISGTSSVCVDIDHPDYGINYTCGSPNANFLFNISYFRNNQFNDSSIIINATFNTTGTNLNKTFYIKQHHYDEFINASIYLEGFTTQGNYPHNIKIYINETLSNSVGDLGTGNLQSTTFNDSSSSKIVYHYSTDLTQEQVLYVDLPKNANISSAKLNITGDNDQWDSATKTCAFLSTTYGLGGVAHHPTAAKVYKADDTNNRICVFNESDLGIDSCWDLNVVSPSPVGIAFDGGYLWVASDGDVFMYTSGGIYTGAHFHTGVTIGDIDSYSLSGGYILIMDDTNNLIKIYSSAGVVQKTINIDSVTANGWGLAYDPYREKLYIGDGVLDETIYEGSLSNSLAKINTSYTLPSNWVENTWKYGQTTPTTGFLDVHYNSTPKISSSYYDIMLSTDSDEDYLCKYNNIKYPPVNPILDIGVQDSIYEWNYGGEFNVSGTTNNTLSDYSSQINSYLSSCTADSLYHCQLPFRFHFFRISEVNISYLNITYTIPPVRVTLNLANITDFFNHSTGFANLPIRFKSDTNGTLQISDIRLDYAGGNKTINVLVYEQIGTSKDTNIENSSSGTRCISPGLAHDGNWSSVGYTEIWSTAENCQWWENVTSYNLTVIPNWTYKIYGYTTTAGSYSNTYTVACWNYTSSSWKTMDTRSNFYNSTDIGQETRTFTLPSECISGNKVQMKYNATVAGTAINHAGYYEGHLDYTLYTGSKANNETLNIYNWYSKLGFNFPKYINYLEFIPSTPTSKNVTPYGQTSSTPIFNITTYNYGGKNMNLSIYLNETHSCVNLTWNTNSTKPSGYIISEQTITYTEDFEEVTFPPVDPLTFKTGGNANWHRNTTGWRIDTASAGSSDISDNQKTWINTSLTFPVAGNISWHWNISSEKSYDFVCYCIDKECGATGCTCQGTAGDADVRFSSSTSGVWTYAYNTQTVTAGQHNFTWCYAKDSSQSYGSDMALVDNIVFNWTQTTTTGSPKLNNTWVDIATNLTYLNNTKVWLWADYSCNFTTWKLWKPTLYLRGCAIGTVCSESLNSAESVIKLKINSKSKIEEIIDWIRRIIWQFVA